MRVAVAGATGNIGARTVSALERNGHEPIRISRLPGVDLTRARVWMRRSTALMRASLLAVCGLPLRAWLLEYRPGRAHLGHPGGYTLPVCPRPVRNAGRQSCTGFKAVGNRGMPLMAAIRCQVDATLVSAPSSADRTAESCSAPSSMTGV
jgi:hypothetical protein